MKNLFLVLTLIILGIPVCAYNSDRIQDELLDPAIYNDMSGNSVFKLGIYKHNQYKYIDQSIKEIDALEIRSKKGDMIFHCSIKDIIKINDKFIYEGKLTLIIQIKEDKIILFISKSTKELLDAFISKITA